MDIEELQLNQFKRLADGEAYFHLFKNHLTGIKACMNVLLYKIENIDCIAKIIDSCSNAHFIVTGDESIFNALKLILSKTISVDYLKNFDLKKNNMKFDFIVMNPPWGGFTSTGLGHKILREAFNHVTDEGKIVCLYGGNALFNVKRAGRRREYAHCKSAATYDANEVFGINHRKSCVCAEFIPSQTFNKIRVDFYHDPRLSGDYSIDEIDPSLNYVKEVIDMFKATKPVYDQLMAASIDGGMTNLSNNQFEYFDSTAKDGHTNKDVPRSRYSFVLNRGSYENVQDSYYDYVKNMGGITWTCKNERIKNNIYFWLHDCPLSFMWKKVLLFEGTAHFFAYKCIPAVNFDMPEDVFKNWCDSLAGGFNKKHSFKEIIDLVNKAH